MEPILMHGIACYVDQPSDQTWPGKLAGGDGGFRHGQADRVIAMRGHPVRGNDTPLNCAAVSHASVGGSASSQAYLEQQKATCVPETPSVVAAPRVGKGPCARAEDRQ